MRRRERDAAPVYGLARGTALGFVLLLLAAFSLSAGVARADSPSADARALRIERSLACPQCTDLPLDVCDRDICADMRTIIQQKIAAGDSDQAIRQYFVDRYGSRVLLAPPKSSLNLLAWLMPFAGLVAGAVAVSIFLRSAAGRSRKAPPLSAEPAAFSPYRTRAEQEAEQYE